MKKLSLLLALALCFGTCAMAEGVTTLEAKPEMVTGPLKIEGAMNSASLLSTSVTFTYGDPGTIIELLLATKRGTGEGALGKLVQLEATATMDVSIDAVRYAAAPAEDGKSIDITLELEWSSEDGAQQITDTLTLTPGENGTLAVVSETGGEAIPTAQ